MFGFVKKFGKYAFLFARRWSNMALYLVALLLCSICLGLVVFSGFLLSFDMSNGVNELVQELDQPLVLRKKVQKVWESDYYEIDKLIPPSQKGGENDMRLSIAESEQIFDICPEAAGYYRTAVRTNLVTESVKNNSVNKTYRPFSFTYQSGARDEYKPIFETEYSGKPEEGSYLFASGETYAALGGELLCGAYPAKEGELALPVYMAYGFLNYGYRTYDPDTGKGGELVQIHDISELIGKQFYLSYKISDYAQVTGGFDPDLNNIFNGEKIYHPSFVVTGIVKSSLGQFEKTVLFSREAKETDTLLGFAAGANSFGKETGYRDELVSYQKIFVPTTVSEEQKSQLVALISDSYEKGRSEYFYSMCSQSGEQTGIETYSEGYWTAQQEIPERTEDWLYSKGRYYAERTVYITMEDSSMTFNSYTRSIDRLREMWPVFLSLSVALVLFGVVILFFFTRMHVGRSRYVTGIFRSLGMRKWKLVLLMALPLFLLTILSALFGVGVTAIMFKLMNYIFGLPLLSPTWVQPAMLGAAVFFFAVVSVALLRFEMRKDPMTLLRGKE